MKTVLYLAEAGAPNGGIQRIIVYLKYAYFLDPNNIFVQCVQVVPTSGISMRSKTVIDVRNLVKNYGRIKAVNGVSFRIYEGEVFAILGPNGAGKTTVLRAISGTLRISGGTVRVLGYDVRRESIKVKSVVGYVPEHHFLFPELSVMRNLLFAATLHGLSKEAATVQAKKVLSALGLEGVSHRKYGELSKGFKRRADIATALIHDPEIIVLDEPTSGLDPYSAVRLRTMIETLPKEGKTVIIATHNISEAMMLADRVLILVGGRVKALGEPRELRELISEESEVLIVLDNPSREFMERVVKSVPKASFVRNTLRVRCRDTAQTLKTILSFADAYGVRVLNVSIKEVTWEDVFMKLVYGECPVKKFLPGRGCGGCPYAGGAE